MDCPPGTYTFNGIMNGTCGPTGFCFLDAWCPVENDDDLDKQQKANLMQNIDNWSILAKANVVRVAFACC